MSAPKDLKLLRSIKTGNGLIKLINSLKQILKLNKLKGLKVSSLNKSYVVAESPAGDSAATLNNFSQINIHQFLV
jgi:hypothetical protein